MKGGAGSAEKEFLQLECPFCAAPVELTKSQLVEGQSVQCPHCRQEAVLTRDRIEHSDQNEWKLIELEFDDERR